MNLIYSTFRSGFTCTNVVFSLVLISNALREKTLRFFTLHFQAELPYWPYFFAVRFTKFSVHLTPLLALFSDSCYTLLFEICPFVQPEKNNFFHYFFNNCDEPEKTTLIFTSSTMWHDYSLQLRSFKS